jgi:hypothetical protein
MSEMVERVARALCRDGGFQDTDSLDHRVRFGSDPPVVDTQPIWRRFEKEARTAIEAMREPALIEDVCRKAADPRTGYICWEGISVHRAADIVDAVLGAALAEPDAP